MALLDRGALMDRGRAQFGLFYGQEISPLITIAELKIHHVICRG